MSRPYSEQLSVGYERQLWRDLRVGVAYYYRTKKNMIGIENTFVAPSDYTPITVLPDENGVPQPIVNGLTGQPLTLFNLDPAKQTAFNFVVTNIPKLNDNTYHGVEFTAVKRLVAQVATPFRIHHSTPEGCIRTGFSDEATSDNFTDPNNDINRRNNYLNSDATYVFKVDSSYELPFKIGTSMNFQHYTGLPIQPVEIFGTNGG